MSKSNVSTALSRVLGDTYMLYLKTHAFHWNVTGQHFHTLHLMFETQYTEMWASLDVIAERLRALGDMAPGSSRAMAALSEIDDGDEGVPKDVEMLKILITDHSTWLEGAEAALKVASDANDVGTEDLLTPLIAAHEKTIWMLRSSLPR